VDSKKLHKPREGIGRLERSALAAATAWRGSPPSMRALLRLVAPHCLDQLGEYRWYHDADPALPLDADAGAIRIAAKLLQQDMETQNVRLAGLWSELLLEGHYNRLVGNTHNKAVVLLGLTLRLMQRIADAFPGRELRFFVDKQGARDHYAPTLLRAFEDRRLKVIHEDHERSEYELVDPKTRWQVSFAQDGETRQMPTAMASILSKYLREALMHCFNEYWRAHVPGITPTAGYYEDGHRFLKEIAEPVGRLGIAKESLVRQR
jgi:hypothetical protein